MSQNRKYHLTLWAIFLSGCLLRLLPALLTDFPINDGGMLLAMIQDLRSNGFLLPSVTSYNFSHIPFAYPPLGFYLAGMLSNCLSISPIELLRWLPAVTSAALIPAFYWLCLQIWDSKSKALMAAALYAVMPGSSDWLVMGGGLTRSLGVLCSLFAIGYVCRLFREHGNKKDLAWAILFCTLTVLSHPEVGLQTAAICFLFWACFGRTLSGTKNAGLVASGTALLTAPWWLAVWRDHGLAPFLSAAQTGIRERLLASLFHTFFSYQGGLPLLPIFGLMGLYAVLRKREFLLVLWFFLPFLVDPRNAPAMAIFPFLMLASEGLYFLYQELIRSSSETSSTNRTKYLPAISRGIFTLILLYLFFVSYRATATLAEISLSAPDRQTMEWVKENTPLGSRFLLMTNTGNISPMTDSYQEWFPVVAERRSQNTLQGLEWTLGSDFFEYSQKLVALQACPDVDCLNAWLKDNHVQVDFVLFQKKRASQPLLDSLDMDERYEQVYESPNAMIFALHP